MIPAERPLTGQEVAIARREKAVDDGGITGGTSPAQRAHQRLITFYTRLNLHGRRGYRRYNICQQAWIEVEFVLYLEDRLELVGRQCCLRPVSAAAPRAG